MDVTASSQYIAVSARTSISVPFHNAYFSNDDCNHRVCDLVSIKKYTTQTMNCTLVRSSSKIRSLPVAICVLHFSMVPMTHCSIAEQRRLFRFLNRCFDIYTSCMLNDFIITSIRQSISRCIHGKLHRIRDDSEDAHSANFHR